MRVGASGASGTVGGSASAGAIPIRNEPAPSVVASTAPRARFSGDLLDPDFWPRLRAHESELAMRCEHIAPTTAIVEVAAPPQPSFE